MKLRTEHYWLDHALAVSAGVMGVYACSMSVANEGMANIMAIWVLMAGIAGYGLSLLVENSKFRNADAWLFAFFGLIGVFQSRAINNLMPDEGFPFAILAATMMFVLLVVGALFAWRDATLLFLSLPSLVLFGLVGTIDSWRPGLFMFCGFLLAIALLYARVHQRTMIRWAEEGGADRRLLWRDVWRWMAGPEYALAAAATIILLSFLGAPVVQTSLSGVSDNVRSSVRNQVRASFQQRGNLGAAQVDVPIGDGPRNLSERVVLRVKEDDPRYLKTGAPAFYRGNGWSYNASSRSFSEIEFNDPGRLLAHRRTTPIKERPLDSVSKELLVEIQPEEPLGSVIPAPGPVVEIDQAATRYRETSTSELISQVGSIDNVIKIVAVVANISTIARNDPNRGDAPAPFIAPIRLPRLEEEALRITEGIQGDYSKAQALRNAIADRCEYNLATPKTPAQKDTAEYFYFESRQGYCDHFATTLTLMARSIGLPARYAVGYLVDPEQRDAQGFMLVRENMSHAWTEIYFEEYGWVVFDATGGARVVAPQNQANDHDLLGKIRAFFRAHAGAILGVLGLCILVAVYALMRSRARVVRTTHPRREVVLLANRLQRALERATRHPKRFSQTHREYAFVHQAALAPVWEPLQASLDTLESALFGSADPTPESLASVRKSVEQVEQSLRDAAKQSVIMDPANRGDRF